MGGGGAAGVGGGWGGISAKIGHSPPPCDYFVKLEYNLDGLG